MKYVLKGLEINVKGEMFSKGNLDANFKIEELELEGNFEEIYKEVLPVMLDIVKPAVNKEIKEEHGDADGNKDNQTHVSKIQEMYNNATEHPYEVIVQGTIVRGVVTTSGVEVTFKDKLGCDEKIFIPLNKENIDLYIDYIITAIV